MNLRHASHRAITTFCIRCSLTITKVFACPSALRKLHSFVDVLKKQEQKYSPLPWGSLKHSRILPYELLGLLPPNPQAEKRRASESVFPTSMRWRSTIASPLLRMPRCQRPQTRRTRPLREAFRGRSLHDTARHHPSPTRNAFNFLPENLTSTTCKASRPPRSITRDSLKIWTYLLLERFIR